MEKKKIFIATDQHRSEYPDPITFKRGTRIVVGEIYEGNEEWENWYFCTITNHSGGWVPAQVIKCVNGWFWCQRLSDNETGWVPVKILEETEYAL